MTREDREDAIDIIQSILDKYEEDECLVTEITIGDEDIKAFKMAIKALEQEPVLDKIRSEIAEYGSIWVEYKITGRKDKDIEQLVTDVLKQAKKQVLDVIDKYKAESEDNRTVTIDKSINQIIDSLMGEKAYLLDHSDRVALTNAVNTMRKYQKIKEIVRFGNANELGFEYVGEKITEVIEDDNSNLDNSSMRSDQSNTEHCSDSGTGKE